MSLFFLLVWILVVLNKNWKILQIFRKLSVGFFSNSKASKSVLWCFGHGKFKKFCTIVKEKMFFDFFWYFFCVHKFLKTKPKFFNAFCYFLMNFSLIRDPDAHTIWIFTRCIKLQTQLLSFYQNIPEISIRQKFHYFRNTHNRIFLHILGSVIWWSEKKITNNLYSRIRRVKYW